MCERHAVSRDLGRRLRTARRARGWGVRELARRAGASYSYLAAIERGERVPGRRVAEGIIGALRLDPATAAELLIHADLVEEGRERRAAEREGRDPERAPGRRRPAERAGPQAFFSRGGQGVSATARQGVTPHPGDQHAPFSRLQLRSRATPVARDRVPEPERAEPDAQRRMRGEARPRDDLATRPW